MLLSIKIALASLAAHKLRAVLAMLGVFLGALALTGVQHVSQAMVRKAEIETEKLGPNLFVAQSGQLRFRRSGTAGFSGSSRTFTLADAETIMGQLPGVLRGAPFVAKQMAVRAAEKTVQCQVVATWPDYVAVRSFAPALGRFFSAKELEARDKVVILGQAIAERLFGSPAAAMGGQVFFFRAGFRVIGVMEPKGRDLSGTNQDEQVFMPLSTYMRRAANQDWITGVYMELAPGTDAEALKTSATTILRQRHRLGRNEKDDFSLLTARDTMELQRQALELVGVLGLLSSSVSFAVGGLGILSIMILLVRARRLEIGVRRALGARRLDIIRQFLFESAFMSAVGGGLGVAASLALTSVVYVLGDFPFIFDPVLVAGSLAGSALIGVAAGAYPAWQAAQVAILDVLRSQA